MKKALTFIALLALAGCTTPKTMLQSESGQVMTCGGNVSSSLAGGAVGYHIQKDNDAECVADLERQGFRVVGTTE